MATGNARPTAGTRATGPAARISRKDKSGREAATGGDAAARDHHEAACVPTIGGEPDFSTTQQAARRPTTFSAPEPMITMGTEAAPHTACMPPRDAQWWRSRPYAGPLRPRPGGRQATRLCGVGTVRFSSA